jgi:hypothetical protein
MASHFQAAIDFIEARKTELGVTDADIYVANLTKYLDSKEDSRAAVLIALDASKSLITIAVAFFAALGAFALNHRSNNQGPISWSLVLLGASAILTVTSMFAGFKALGKACKRAQKPPDAEGPQWATEPLGWWLGTQSFLGLAALGCFGSAMFLWEPQANKPPDPQIARLQQSVDGLTQQATELAQLGQNAITPTGDLMTRLEQLTNELSRLSQNAATAAPSIAAIPVLDRRMRELGDAIADIRSRLPLPPQPGARGGQGRVAR